MPYMKRRLISLMMAALLSLPLVAQPLDFTRIDRSPRTSALAGAGSASVSSVAYASFANAAAIPFYDGKADLGLGYQHWAPAMGAASAFHIGGAYNLGFLGVALGGAYVMEQPAPDGFRPYKFQVNLGVGARITSWLSAGVNVRLVREVNALDVPASYTGFNGDVLLMARPLEGLGVTLGVSNLGNSLKDSYGNVYQQPASVKAAAAYKIGFAADHSVEAMLDGDYYFFSNGFAVSGGVEYAFRQMVFARAGYRWAGEHAPFASHLALGLGVQFYGVRLELSWLGVSPVLANTFCVGLGYRF